jgi:hypothetical protein
LKLVRLDISWDPTFWQHVLRDVPNYYFFIADWKLGRDKTEILLAIHDDHIVGSLLIFNQRIVHLRGSPEAAALLLTEVDLETAEFTVLKEHESAVLRDFTLVTRHEMMLMTLERGEEHLLIQHPVVRLGPADAEAIIGLLGEAFPDVENPTSDRFVEHMKQGVCYLGIKTDGQVVSFAGARILDC